MFEGTVLSSLTYPQVLHLAHSRHVCAIGGSSLLGIDDFIVKLLVHRLILSQCI